MGIRRTKKRKEKEKERKLKKICSASGKPHTVNLPAGFGPDRESLTPEKMHELLLESPELLSSPQFKDFMLDPFLAIKYTNDVFAKYKIEDEDNEPSEDVVLKCYSEIFRRLFTKEIEKEFKKRLQKYAEFHAKRGDEKEVMVAMITEATFSSKSIPLGAHPFLIRLYQLSINKLPEKGDVEDMLSSHTAGSELFEMKQGKIEKKKPSLFKRIVQAVKKARDGE